MKVHQSAKRIALAMGVAKAAKQMWPRLKLWVHPFARRALLAALFAAGPAAVQPAWSKAPAVRMDDSGTSADQGTVQMQWRPIATGLGKAQEPGMEAQFAVRVHVVTRPWLGQHGKIFLVMQRDEVSSLEVSWTGQGVLQSGRLRPGERALVFAGRISGPTLEDRLLMMMRSAADWQRDLRRVQFQFEWESD